MSERLLIEFLRRDGEPLLLSDLGMDYLDSLSLPLSRSHRPFRVEAEPRTSSRGYVHFDYQQGGIPLPDGLETRLRVGGVEVRLGTERTSQAGNRGREGSSVVQLGDRPFEVRVYLSRTAKQFWISVRALQRLCGRAARPAAPIRGGSIV